VGILVRNGFVHQQTAYIGGSELIMQLRKPTTELQAPRQTAKAGVISVA